MTKFSSSWKYFKGDKKVISREILIHQTLNYFLKVGHIGYDEEFMLYLSSFGKHFSHIRVLAIEILAANERSLIISREEFEVVLVLIYRF